MSTNAYDAIAGVYDQFQKEMDPVAWADYVYEMFYRKQAEHDYQGENGKPLLLELGCGTGRVLVELANLGFDVIGVDSSAGMLNVAREQFVDRGQDALLSRQDITDFELYGTVDCCVSLLDTLNHLTDERKIKACFALVANYLNPGGVFLFDLATPHHFQQTLGDKQFFDVTETYAVLWQNTYQPLLGLSQSDITLFESTGDGLFTRSETRIIERCYSIDDILSWLESAGFIEIEVFGEQTFSFPSDTEERVFVAARSGKKS